MKSVRREATKSEKLYLREQVHKFDEIRQEYLKEKEKEHNEMIKVLNLIR
jgi:hypothetical protein